LKITWAVLQRDGGEGVEEARAAEELGDEDGGVGLRLRAVDPLDAGAEHAGVAAPLAQDAAAVAAHLPSYIYPGPIDLLLRSPFNSLAPVSIYMEANAHRPAVCSRTRKLSAMEAYRSS